MLIPAHKIYTLQGLVVGQASNLIMGCLLSTPIVYLLSLTGKEKALLKGTGVGMTAWIGFYGALANLGFSSVRPALPQTVLTNLVAHAVFGSTVTLIATRLGDPHLYDGTIPLFVTQRGKQHQLEETFEQQAISPDITRVEEPTVSPH